MFVKNISRKWVFALRFTWEPQKIVRVARREGIWFLEFLGDAAGSRQGPPPIEAGVLRTQRARVTYEFKGFRETPVRAAHAVERAPLTDFSLRAQLEAGWRRPELRGSSRSATSPFSWEPFRSCPLSPSSGVLLTLPAVRALSILFTRPLFPAFFIFSPPRAVGGPILARGRPATVSREWTRTKRRFAVRREKEDC